MGVEMNTWAKREGDERYRLLIELIGDGIIIIQSPGIYTGYRPIRIFPA
jgi:hypothetical protein